jgi:hypothetical protein
MMSNKITRTVLFRPSEGLIHYLTGVVRNEDGTIKTGYVQNGDYRLEVRNGEYLSKGYKGFIVTRNPVRGDEYEVPVQPDWKGDYQTIINRAKEEHAHTLPGI